MPIVKNIDHFNQWMYAYPFYNNVHNAQEAFKDVAEELDVYSEDDVQKLVDEVPTL